MPDIGRSIIFLGVILIVIGIFVAYGQKIPFLGKLPGDIFIKKDGFSFNFPLTTSILISVIISLVLRFLHINNYPLNLLWVDF